MKREVARQLLHLLLGFLVIELLILFGKPVALASTVLILFLGLIISLLLANGIKVPFFHGVVRHVQRRHETRLPGKAAIMFIIAAIFTLLLFYLPDYKVAFAALIVLSVGDSFSSIFGTACGKTRIIKGRTLEGTAAGIVFSFAFLVLVFSPYKAFLVALFGMLAEYLPFDDNFTIPMAAGLAAMLI